MNKTELIDALADDTGLSRAEATRALEKVLNIITRELQGGRPVALVGFGTFLVRERAARKGRNPRTNQEIQINASKVPAFKPGKALKDSLN